MSKEKAPYLSLGSHLKYVREQSHQSLAEVSGAVEIDEKVLSDIEAGKERPDEEILLLLISHFNVKDREAVQLWELADYDTDLPDQIKLDNDNNTPKTMVMLLANDNRTMYSDGIEIITNNAGVTMNFTQMQNPTQASTVAKVGMSFDQAQEVLNTLQKALIKARYLGNHNRLPDQTRRKPSKENHSK